LSSTLPKLFFRHNASFEGCAQKARKVGYSSRSAMESPGAMRKVSAAFPREMAMETFWYASS
jgi:hypothetical protein